MFSLGLLGRGMFGVWKLVVMSEFSMEFLGKSSLSCSFFFFWTLRSPISGGDWFEDRIGIWLEAGVIVYVYENDSRLRRFDDFAPCVVFVFHCLLQTATSRSAHHAFQEVPRKVPYQLW